MKTSLLLCIIICGNSILNATMYVPYHNSHFTVYRDKDGSHYQVAFPVQSKSTRISDLVAPETLVPPQPTTYVPNNETKNIIIDLDNYDIIDAQQTDEQRLDKPHTAIED